MPHPSTSVYAMPSANPLSRNTSPSRLRSASSCPCSTSSWNAPGSVQGSAPSGCCFRMTCRADSGTVANPSVARRSSSVVFPVPGPPVRTYFLISAPPVDLSDVVLLALLLPPRLLLRGVVVVKIGLRCLRFERIDEAGGIELLHVLQQEEHIRILRWRHPVLRPPHEFSALAVDVQLRIPNGQDRKVSPSVHDSLAEASSAVRFQRQPGHLPPELALAPRIVPFFARELLHLSVQRGHRPAAQNLSTPWRALRPPPGRVVCNLAGRVRRRPGELPRIDPRRCSTGLPGNATPLTMFLVVVLHGPSPPLGLLRGATGELRDIIHPGRASPPLVLGRSGEGLEALTILLGELLLPNGEHALPFLSRGCEEHAVSAGECLSHRWLLQDAPVEDERGMLLQSLVDIAGLAHAQLPLEVHVIYLNEVVMIELLPPGVCLLVQQSHTPQPLCQVPSHCVHLRRYV